MTSKLRRTAVLLAGVLLAVVSGQRLERISGERDSASALLYLPNGRYLKAASLGQAPVLADLVYLWAIQYYANYDREDRYRYVEHIFKDVIAELDPHYVDAYWLGALILTVEARDLEAGLRILDLGFENNPESWVLPYLGAWECHFAGEFALAAEYFRRAAAVEGAPPMVRRMVGGMEQRAGNPRQAMLEWQSILEDPNSDPASQAIAERQVRDLKVKLDVEELTRAIRAFRERNRGNPPDLARLLTDRYIERVPLDPDGRPYVYDAQAGSVKSSAGRILGDR